jgi:hypothetical protein
MESVIEDQMKKTENNELIMGDCAGSWPWNKKTDCYLYTRKKQYMKNCMNTSTLSGNTQRSLSTLN